MIHRYPTYLALVLCLVLSNCDIVTSTDYNELEIHEGVYRLSGRSYPHSGEVCTYYAGTSQRSGRTELKSGKARGRAVSYGLAGEITSESYTVGVELPPIPDIYRANGWLSREGKFFSYGLTFIVKEMPEDLPNDSLIISLHRQSLQRLPPPGAGDVDENLTILYRIGELAPPLKLQTISRDEVSRR